MSETYQRAPPAELPVAPGDPRTLGYGTDQARWLKEEMKRKAQSGAAANPFRCVHGRGAARKCP
jgi:hypothetical protein